MKRNILLLVLFLSSSVMCFGQTWPSSTVGRWTFDNTSDLLHATVGNDLTLTGSHVPVNGPVAGDGAVAVDVGSYYTCTHGIAPNGGGSGSYVNEFSMLFDIMIDNPKVFHSLFQTNQSNSNDGDAFINTNSQLGITATGYSGFSLKAKLWYRVVVTVDNGSSFRYYINGHLVMEGIAQPVDLTYGLDPTLLFFADENGEDNMIYCAQLAIFSTCLSSAEVTGLGGFRSSDIKPYLQSPTTNSICISWNSFDNASTLVEYGTTSLLGSFTSGTFEDIGANRWHTVKLIGLTPDTHYYYRCISGVDTSLVYSFRTPVIPGTNSGHIRFVKLGDSQDDAIQSTAIADTIVWLLKDLYGNNWQDSISFVMHSGDITQDGNTLGRYMNEYFNSYSPLSAYIPFMISIGNHEGESAYYYQFMKYDGLTGFNEKYYSFNLGNCQFISMNTNGTYSNSTQTNWLQSQLNQSAMDANTDFVFTFFHEPAHSEMWPDGNTSYVEDYVLPTEMNYPKMVMSTYGHSHNYERGTLLANNGSNWDFRIVLCGGAGGPLDRWGMYTNQTDYSEIQKAFDHYSFVLVDVDMAAKTVNASMYSLGNSDRPRNLDVLDKWHRFLNQAAPDKPHALWPDSVASDAPILVASPFSGVDTLMSSEFQLVSLSGSFNSPLVDAIRDNENYYGDSGYPQFNPSNLNIGIDLKRYPIGVGSLTVGQTYMWRMRYRDQNVRWSDWSDTLVFTVVSNPADEVDFMADVTSGSAPLTVHFTDLSVYNPVSWQWDFDNDAIVDANIQDPVYVYNTPGLYTVSLTSQVNSLILNKTKLQYINVLTMGISNGNIENLFTAYPNPSDGLTNFCFQSDGKTTAVIITDINGRVIRNLVNGILSAGYQHLIWDGTDNVGNIVPPGMYFCQFKSSSFCKVLKTIKY
jgi:hypothetical protein